MAQVGAEFRFGPYATQSWGDAIPSAATEIGPFNLGDIRWNTVPATGGATYIGWVCTVAGATGASSTWKGFGLIA
jgi:hypothetical protein